VYLYGEELYSHISLTSLPPPPFKLHCLPKLWKTFNSQSRYRKPSYTNETRHGYDSEGEKVYETEENCSLGGNRLLDDVKRVRGEMCEAGSESEKTGSFLNEDVP
jgi:hypothetical protein